MMSKNFNDFLDTINSEKVNEIIGNDKLINFKLTNDGMQEYTNTLLSKSLEMSIALLQSYHDWLNSDSKD